jgi:hypothetical protein
MGCADGYLIGARRFSSRTRVVRPIAARADAILATAPLILMSSHELSSARRNALLQLL